MPQTILPAMSLNERFTAIASTKPVRPARRSIVSAPKNKVVTLDNSKLLQQLLQEDQRQEALIQQMRADLLAALPRVSRKGAQRRHLAQSSAKSYEKPQLAQPIFKQPLQGRKRRGIEAAVPVKARLGVRAGKHNKTVNVVAASKRHGVRKAPKSGQPKNTKQGVLVGGVQEAQAAAGKAKLLKQQKLGMHKNSAAAQKHANQQRVDKLKKKKPNRSVANQQKQQQQRVAVGRVKRVKAAAKQLLAKPQPVNKEQLDKELELYMLRAQSTKKGAMQNNIAAEIKDANDKQQQILEKSNMTAEIDQKKENIVDILLKKSRGGKKIEF